MEKIEEERMLEQMRTVRLRPWQCSGCGAEVSGEHLRCPVCRRRKGATTDEPDMDMWEAEEESDPEW